MSQIKLFLHQGDNKSWPVTISASGSPSTVDLTGVTLSGDIRAEYNTDIVGSFTFTETDLANGQFSIDISAATSAALPIEDFRKSFVFDIQIDWPGGNIDTPISGYLIVQREVTR